MPIEKPWYTSKTIWTNLLLSVLSVISAASPWVREHLSAETQAQVIAGAFGVANLILRIVTKDKLSLS